MFPIDRIHCLTDFKRDTAAFRARLKKSGKPELLTVDGRPDLIVQDAAAYEKVMAGVDQILKLAGLQRKIKALQSRQGKSARRR